MSVLSFPRIYFKGFMEWDPCTFNNNDWTEFPTYDPTNAALNWSFLATQNPPITPANFGTTFRPWAIALRSSGKGRSCKWPSRKNSGASRATRSWLIFFKIPFSRGACSRQTASCEDNAMVQLTPELRISTG